MRRAPGGTLRMLRSLRGLGDTTCTATSCAGPYDNPQYNYDYWLTQGAAAGAVQTQPGSQTETVDVTAVQQAQAGGASGVTYQQLMAAAGVVLCTGADMDVSEQWACSQANQPRLQAISDLQIRTGGNPSQADLAALAAKFGGSLAYTPSPAQAAAAIAATATAARGDTRGTAAQGGTLSFAPSRGGGILQPGDTWTITISGASPNTQVTVQGGKNGASDKTPMGSTDGSGNFSLSGTITADNIGSWAETWYVGSALSGSFNFQVVAAGTITTPAATGGAVPATAPAAPLIPASVQSWFTSTMIDGIPNWVLALGAVGVGWFLLRGKK